jgi:surfeit locus 1 family protein
LFWPTALVFCCALILAGLGTWQLQRKQWKEALISSIAARVAAPPVPLAEAVARNADGAGIDYLHVRATGQLRNDAERYLYAPSASGPGWHVYTPLAIDAQHFVWVNRGFVPDAKRQPETRRQGLLEGEVAITGLIRAARARGAFQPANEPATNTWYWPDVGELTASLSPRGHALPFTIDADGLPEAPGGLPRGGVTRLALANPHLGYAATWYALALALIAVYSAAAARRLRAAPAAAGVPGAVLPGAAAGAAAGPGSDRGLTARQDTGPDARSDTMSDAESDTWSDSVAGPGAGEKKPRHQGPAEGREQASEECPRSGQEKGQNA